MSAALLVARRRCGAEPHVWAKVCGLLAAWRTPAELAAQVALNPAQVSRALRRRLGLGEVERRERRTGRRGRPEYAYRLAERA